MKAIELREMGEEQLALTLKETNENLFRLRIQSQTERLDAPSELRRNKRLIARIKTIQRERELAAKAAPAETPKTEAAQAEKD
jgi:large subunit ribosomal protein L29